MEWVAVALFGFIAWASVQSAPAPLPDKETLREVPPGKYVLDTAPLSSMPTAESIETYNSAGDE